MEMSVQLKKKILKLLEEDTEFRYTVAGYIGYTEILRNIEKIWIEIKELREEQEKMLDNQSRLWENTNKLWEGQNRLLEEVVSLRIGQEKIWESIDKLWNGQNKLLGRS
jgi:DNA repair exonuclease SbcCD ATPase subunit